MTFAPIRQHRNCDLSIDLEIACFLYDFCISPVLQCADKLVLYQNRLVSLWLLHQKGIPTTLPIPKCWNIAYISYDFRNFLSSLSNLPCGNHRNRLVFLWLPIHFRKQSKTSSAIWLAGRFTFLRKTKRFRWFPSQSRYRGFGGSPKSYKNKWFCGNQSDVGMCSKSARN